MTRRYLRYVLLHPFLNRSDTYFVRYSGRVTQPLESSFVDFLQLSVLVEECYNVFVEDGHS